MLKYYLRLLLIMKFDDDDDPDDDGDDDPDEDPEGF